MLYERGSLSTEALLRMYSKQIIQKTKKLYQKEKSLRKVAKRLNMSVSTVAYIVKNNYNKEKKKRGPRFKIDTKKTTLIKREVRRLKRLNQKVTAKKIKEACNIDVSIRTIERKLSKIDFGYGQRQKSEESGDIKEENS
jgi:DNA-binding CsgD family transcriptional regulator